MKRLYYSLLKHHFANFDQMAFMSGPRQVGKTTVSRYLEETQEYFKYLNWDKSKDRKLMLSDSSDILFGLPIDAVLTQKPTIVFDEIYKYKHWKTFIKGFVDEYKTKLNIMVTGSSKLNVFRKGGDSLMGRYFLYRIHPFSIGEIINTSIPEAPLSPPKKINEKELELLLKFGGFPEPMLKQSETFYNRWKNLRHQQMFREDIQDLAQIQEIAQLEVLALLLQEQPGQMVSYNKLASKVQVSAPTVRRWIGVLESFYYCFKIKPWSKNVSRSLLKEPKLYLWDWSYISDKGARIENFVASHLIKAVHFWTDFGFGDFDLFFLRDKEKHEVDFLITKNKKPWIMVEVKTSAKQSLNNSLHHFQKQVNAEFVLQLAYDLPYVDQDFREFKDSIKIFPATTFLSQLV